jgi:hypothetical protein
VPGTSILSYSEAKTNILCGLTVVLALVPEAIAFALVDHANRLSGFYAAFVMCVAFIFSWRIVSESYGRSVSELFGVQGAERFETGACHRLLRVAGLGSFPGVAESAENATSQAHELLSTLRSALA